MMNRRNFTLCVLGLMALAVMGCQAPSTPPYHYKLKVEIETPDGLRTGSSVIAVHTTSPMSGAEALGGGGPTARGEALAVDLPNGKALFVLLRSEHDVDWAGSAHINSTGLKEDNFSEKAQFLGRLRSSRIVYPIHRWVEMRNGEKINNYPMMVMFDDINDPTTVKRLNPDDLAASLGAGYRLKTVTVVGTDKSQEFNIKNRFVWWEKYENRHFDGSSTIVENMQNPALSAHLSSGSFSSEFNR